MRLFLFVLGAVFMMNIADAQFSISLNFNIDRQPLWGPTGYDHVEYYYLPDLEVYYYIPQRMFYYREGGRWIGRSALPSRYRGYNLYNSYKVVVNDPTPYRHHDTYRDKYSSYKGRSGQQAIRDSRDEKYFVNAKHPEHSRWVQQRKQNNDNSKEKGRGNKSGRK